MANAPRLLGRYQLLAELGRGSMGVVYRARDPQIARDVALKVMTSDLDEAHLKRFRREGEIAAKLDHPGLVRIHSAGTFPDGRPFLAMELVAGETFTDATRRLPVPERVQLLRDAAEAVGHAHQNGVVHRDLKPDNLLVGPDGAVRVTDFGIARAEGLDRMTRSGATLGTPGYMAPEQFTAAHRVGPPSDVWSLGVMLYELLTDEHPFPASSLQELVHQVTDGTIERPSHIVPNVSRRLERVCLTCLDRVPARRYPDGAALAADLDRALGGQSTVAERAARRRSLRRLALLGAALLVGALAVALALRATSAPPPTDPDLTSGDQEQAPQQTVERLLRAGDFEGARAAADAWSSSSSDPQARRMRGHARLLLGDLAGAEDDLRTASSREREALRLARHLQATEERLKTIVPATPFPVSDELGETLSQDLERTTGRLRKLGGLPAGLREPLIARAHQVQASVVIALSLNRPFNGREYSAAVEESAALGQGVHAAQLRIAGLWHLRGGDRGDPLVPEDLVAWVHSPRAETLDPGYLRLLRILYVLRAIQDRSPENAQALADMARWCTQETALPPLLDNLYVPWRSLWTRLCRIERHLGWLALCEGDRERGLAHRDASVEAGEQALAHDADPGATIVRMNLALSYLLGKEVERARTVIGPFASHKAADMARAQLIHAECDLAAGQHESALNRLEHAIGMFDAGRPDQNYFEELWVARMHARHLLGRPDAMEGLVPEKRPLAHIDWHSPERLRDVLTHWWPGKPLPPPRAPR